MRMIRRLATEAKEEMERQGAAFSDGIEQIQQKQIAQMTDTMKSSLLRDMEKGSEVESAHLFGTLLSKDDTTQVLLPAIYANLEIYRTSRKDV